MMLLLLFTYCTVLLHCAMSYRTTIINDPRYDQRLLQEHQGDAALVRSPRQNRYNAPGNSFQFPWNENFHQFNGGFPRYNKGNNFGSNNNNFNKNIRRPLRQSDIIFVDEDYDINDVVAPNVPVTPTASTPSSTITAAPGSATPGPRCEKNCQATSQFDPVCGNNNVTYTNINWLKCAQNCGKHVSLQYVGACPRVG